MKRLVWLGSSLDEVRNWTAEAQRDSGYQLFKVQSGLEPSDWRPMPGVGKGVQELRIHCGNEYRIIYTATMAEAVYVLHAFEKKTRKTPRTSLDIARQRLQRLLNQRRHT